MRIDSPKNERVKEWRRLQTRKGREEAKAALVEGWHLVEEALKSGARVREVIVQEGAEISLNFRDMAQTIVTRRVMESLCETESPQPIAAVVEIPDYGELTGRGKWVLLDGVQDPGNVGTIIRTADAAGMTGVVLGLGCADAWGGKTLRATQGSIFHLPVLTVSIEEAVTKIKGDGGKIFGSGAGAYSVDYREAKAGGSFGLVLGSEGSGVRPEILAQCDAVLRVPMKGKAESLSVAVAAGILMFELTSRF